MKKQYQVTGMTCAACSAAVEKAVRKLDGVQNVTVNLLQNSMQVEYIDTTLSSQQVIQAVEKAGYQATTLDRKSAEQPATFEESFAIKQKSIKKRLLLSIAFLVPLMWVSMGHMVGLPLPYFLSGVEGAIPFALTQLFLTLPILYFNKQYFETGFKTLYHKTPNMDTLIAIGSSAAVLYGIFALYRMSWAMGTGDLHIVHQYQMDLYFESAAMILTLITLGKFLEHNAKGKTTAAIQALLDLAPKTALVQRQGQEIEIPLEEVVVGDKIVIKPGMRIPVDGVILEGSSSIDESAITGESIPVHKEKGDTVISATMNKNGSFVFEAKKVGENTTLAQIVELVKQAGSGKAPIAKLADKVSGVFVPIVLVISLVCFVVWLAMGQGLEFALARSIAVLVISCPCALGLATPVAIMVATGRGAKSGILFQDAEALEKAHKIDTIILDKTGTITQGKPFVTDIVLLEGVVAQNFWQAAAALEQPSEHPLADAIVEYAKSQEIAITPAQKFSAISGKGLRAVWKEEEWTVGNQRLMQEMQIDISVGEIYAQQFSLQGKTPLYFAKEGILQAVVAVADIVKPTSKATIQKLVNMGIDVWMVTGDNYTTASAIQRQLKIPNVKAEVLPQDKEQILREFQAQGKKVVMVGDGINDAPALVRADVGIAIGAGTDVAIESADVVLMRSDLWDVITTISLSKSVVKNIKQNLFWAFFYNIIGIPLAAGALWSSFGLVLNPMFGAAAMSLSSVCVVSNALRLNLFKNPIVSQSTEHISADQNHSIQQFSMKRGNFAKKVPESLSDISHQTVLEVEGMMCDHCVGRVEKALLQHEKVKKVAVSLEKELVVIESDSTLEVTELIDRLQDAGYSAKLSKK